MDRLRRFGTITTGRTPRGSGLPVLAAALVVSALMIGCAIYSGKRNRSPNSWAVQV